VQVGVFLDGRNPAAWRRPWDEHHRRLVELAVQAEALGADAVWLTEHHFFDDGYLPQPMVLAAAIAARTSTIRIGTAVMIAPLRHPLHIAEEAAVVDQLSGGRLELGFGAGWAKQEFDAFGVDPATRFHVTDTAVAAVHDAFNLVTPPPAQRPVPLWLGYQTPAGARRAGQLGVGLLSLNRASLAPYQAGLAEGGHDVASGRMGGLVELILSDDPPAAEQRILPHYAHQLNSYAQAHAWPASPAEPAVTIDGLRERRRPADSVSMTVCTADQAVTIITELVRDLPVQHIYLWASVAAMPDDLVQRHLELLFTQVRPALQGADIEEST